jgi:quercetin dioxygenase-like cupin family protein
MQWIHVLEHVIARRMTTAESPVGASFVPIADGVEMRILRRHEGQGTTSLIRMRHGAVAPLHHHPGGEETYMLEGRPRIRHRVDERGTQRPDVVLAQGECAFVPPGETHDGVAEEAALFLVVAPGGFASPTKKNLLADG